MDDKNREEAHMKKLISMLLALILLTACAAMGENETEVWKMRKLTESGRNADFDGDGDYETLSVTFDLNEYDDGSFTIGLDGQPVTVEYCASLLTDVYAMTVGGSGYYYGTLFFVSEYGMSDDPYTYCFFYTDNKLMQAGNIPNLAENFSVSPSGVITTEVRAWHIGTWYYPADYILARGMEWDENDDVVWSYAFAKVPAASYPMGMIVKTKIDLPLLGSLFDTEPSLTIPAGEKIILSATDDRGWVGVSMMDGETAGFLRFTAIEYGEYMNIGDDLMYVDDVFDGIFYAD